MTINGATAIGIGTVYASAGDSRLALLHIEPQIIATSIAACILGLWFGGWALQSQSIDAANAEGDDNTRALVLQRALDWVNEPPESAAGQAAALALEELERLPFVRPKADLRAIQFTAASWALWGTGTLALAVDVMAHPVAGWFKGLHLG
jgi:hypothetical protein